MAGEIKENHKKILVKKTKLNFNRRMWSFFLNFSSLLNDRSSEAGVLRFSPVAFHKLNPRHSPPDDMAEMDIICNIQINTASRIGRCNADHN